MSDALLFSLIPDLLCVVLCATAAVLDVRTRRIPNRLTFPALLVGLSLSFVLHARFGWRAGLSEGLFPSFLGAAALFVAFAIFNKAGGIGAGDVKLMAAVGALLRWPLALWALSFVLFSGAVCALVYAAATGQVKSVARNILLGVKRRFGRFADSVPRSPHTMPYGPAILLGTAAAVLFRYRTLL